MRLLRLLVVSVLFIILSSTVYAGWTDSIQKGWEKTKKIGEKAIDSTDGLCFWCDDSIAGTKTEFKGTIEKYDDQQVTVGDKFSNGKELLFSV